MAREIALVALLCAAAAPAAALTEDEERAKAHFLAGQSYYDQASYADALKEFGEAYRISRRPALLYNIARCYEGMDQLDKAVDNLNGYLQATPNADDREAVESRIKNLQELIQASAREHEKEMRLRPPRQEEQKPAMAPTAPEVKPTPSPVVAQPAAQPPPPPRHRRWTWIVGGIGIGVLAAALGTGIASQLSYNDLGSKCPSNLCSGDLSGQVDSGKQLAIATDVLWPIGAAAMVTAIVLFAVEGRHASTRAARTPFATPSTGGMAFAHAF
jgi:tetratricopeptide (TPR) repeat protein